MQISRYWRLQRQLRDPAKAVRYEVWAQERVQQERLKIANGTKEGQTQPEVELLSVGP